MIPEVKLPDIPSAETICFSVKPNTEDKPALTPNVLHIAVG